jgi:hypothetical protein
MESAQGQLCRTSSQRLAIHLGRSASAYRLPMHFGKRPRATRLECGQFEDSVLLIQTFWTGVVAGGFLS